MRRDGFTLLELLVAVAVFGLLLAGLTQGTLYVLRARQNEDGTFLAAAKSGTVYRVLRQMIAVMDPGDSLTLPPFVGGRDKVEFVTVLPDVAVGLPVRRVEAGLLVD